ncbi:MAG: hypothetical protein ACFUZC_08045 [Chthoniobacteraceae bacterium]
MRLHIDVLLALLLATESLACAEKVNQITQYGITWTFEEPCESGRFVTGDYWIVGPVTVTGVTPASGPDAIDRGLFAGGKSRYGAVSLVEDNRMRNGSMVVTGRDTSESGKNARTGFENQGYDSRGPNYDPKLTVQYPFRLEPNRTLISTISSEARDAKGQLTTPFVLGENGIRLCGCTMPLALKTAAVLTCLPSVPPADAFRPSYVGNDKPLYRESQIKWDLLPKLKPVESTPDWTKIERLFERPWLDNTYAWLNQYMMPGENQPNYGREFARVSSIAALMVLLDVPQEQKKTLLLRYIQLGIDLSGVAQLGRQWFSDGGHWQGRKWPILFSSIILDAPELRKFPAVDPNVSVYGRFKIASQANTPIPTTLFQEDIDTYYGHGGDGQTALWQAVVHTGQRKPFEEKPHASFNKDDHFLDGYRINNSEASIGVALAARWMKARAIWNHNAFFDYIDRWMSPDANYVPPKWYPAGCTRTPDLFIEQMWAAHRAAAPAQSTGKDDLKWVWIDGLTGALVPNDPETAIRPESPESK